MPEVVEAEPNSLVFFDAFALEHFDVFRGAIPAASHAALVWWFSWRLEANGLEARFGPLSVLPTNRD
jgi:hypothetical protein